MHRLVDRLCLIDREAFGEKAWGRENFCRVFPCKFQLSRVALRNQVPIGYLIGSRYERKWGHIHRLVVSSPFQRKGIAAKLVRRFEEACLARRIAMLTLESHISGDAANAFYEHIGFARLSEGELVSYLERKRRTDMRQRYAGLSAQGALIVYGKRLA